MNDEMEMHSTDTTLSRKKQTENEINKQKMLHIH
jgi:hypothetical protein